MANTQLISQYAKLERWVDQLSHAQYSIVMGALFATVWTIMEATLGNQPIWMALFFGLFGGTINGALAYFWRK
ncbi:hypothetical protein [Halococcus sp. IIIV-5B]|uniref:hypothetical protein n=1 Tax=Halococcus sp. IIIV-5B TaxID=2321230 RepID=UPI000E70E21B|nr:hypothetical protein [Halococcus sp. IIIV-5B]RJT07428.1 hypothetical protein D3261_02090 [Halococcus sp. IIIV-5B]